MWKKKILLGVCEEIYKMKISRTLSFANKLRGEITVPGDKSLSHRALMFNSLAKGKAHIKGLLHSDDTNSTIDCLKKFGVDIQNDSDGSILIFGKGMHSLNEPNDVLDCGNSGTTMRLLSGICAGINGISILTGDDSLRSRPMDRIVDPLTFLGAQIFARNNNSLPPVMIKGGKIIGGQRITPSAASAQVKSAILLAGLYADEEITVVESKTTRDHTEKLLGAMGAKFSIHGNEITLSPPQNELSAIDVTVPGDISTAAVWIVAASIHPDAELTLRNVGINQTRSGLIDILRLMGGDIKLENNRYIGGEPVADLIVRSASLTGVNVSGELIPRAIDELPLVALAGAVADGETVIQDAQELRVKESDRISTTFKILSDFGVKIEELDDGLHVYGGNPINGAIMNSSGDHRLAMLGAAAGLIADGETTVEDADSVTVSYPTFWEDMEKICQL